MLDNDGGPRAASAKGLQTENDNHSQHSVSISQCKLTKLVPKDKRREPRWRLDLDPTKALPSWRLVLGTATVELTTAQLINPYRCRDAVFRQTFLILRPMSRTDWVCAVNALLREKTIVEVEDGLPASGTRNGKNK